MVNLEAARAICEMKEASAKELYPAISGNLLFILFIIFIIFILCINRNNMS
jgi:hypothetical protein